MTNDLTFWILKKGRIVLTIATIIFSYVIWGAYDWRLATVIAAGTSAMVFLPCVNIAVVFFVVLGWGFVASFLALYLFYGTPTPEHGAMPVGLSVFVVSVCIAFGLHLKLTEDHEF